MGEVGDKKSGHFVRRSRSEAVVVLATKLDESKQSFSKTRNDEKTNGVVLESESLELGSELGEKASIDELLRAPGKKRGQEPLQLGKRRRVRRGS